MELCIRILGSTPVAAWGRTSLRQARHGSERLFGLACVSYRFSLRSTLKSAPRTELFKASNTHKLGSCSTGKFRLYIICGAPAEMGDECMITNNSPASINARVLGKQAPLIYIYRYIWSNREIHSFHTQAPLVRWIYINWLSDWLSRIPWSATSHYPAVVIRYKMVDTRGRTYLDINGNNTRWKKLEKSGQIQNNRIGRKQPP